MNQVLKFEAAIANFFGSPYAVATDCCTHAIELCLRHRGYKSVGCPARTYVSIPMTIFKLGLDYYWRDYKWKNYYYLDRTDIIDAAVLWERDSYIPETLMCLSFQFQKHLSLGRGGAILCDNVTDYDTLKKMSHDGRTPVVPWKEQDIDTIGYHYYMTLEVAQDGLDKLPDAINRAPKIWTQDDYPFLPDMEVFQ
jgi:dTDP-4-amino-4,6-dideoxygalactose transaminase